MKKVWVIYDCETNDLYDHVFYETEEDAERIVKVLKAYGYYLYVVELNKYHERDDEFIEMTD